MSSPFAVFRRHQKALTVVLTILAMFAFIILDSVSRMNTSAIMPIVGAIVGAALAWLWGTQQEGGISNGSIGFGAVLGVIVGTVIIYQSTGQSGISTDIGRISDRELFEMKQQRELANQIVMGAFRERKENAFPFLMQRFLFGGSTTQEVLVKKLLLHEADQMGIAISDEYITKHIKDVSEDNLTRKKLTELRSQMGLGEAEVYEILRTELRAQVAYRVLNPEAVHMPAQYWKDFEKLNVRHSIDAVAVPVEPFVAEQAQPSDAELQALFEQFKNVPPMGENPGFMQPDRLQIAWLETNYEAAEKLVGEIPEEDLKAAYEERKETFYRIEALPDGDFGSDLDLDLGDAPKFGEPPAAPKKITDGEASEAPNTEAKEPTESNPDSEDTPAEPAKEASTEEPPAKKEDAPTEPAKDETPADKAPVTDSPASRIAAPDQDEAEASDDSEGSEEATTEESSDAAREPETAAASDEKTDEPAASTDEGKTEEAADSADSEKPDSESEVPASEVKYRPFEDVRDEVRDIVLRDRTEALMQKQIDAAISAVKDWRFTIRESNSEVTDADLAKQIAEKAAAYAAEKGLTFVETDGHLSYQELLEHEEYKIGTAREPFDVSNFNPQNPQQPQTVSERLFTGATTLFIPEEAEGQLDDSRYAFWAAGEQEQHVPTFEEAGVRDQVIEAFKTLKARPVAEARAKAIAELLTDKIGGGEIASISEGIAGETVLGSGSAKSESDEASDDSPEAAEETEEASSDEAETDSSAEEGEEAVDDSEAAADSDEAAEEKDAAESEETASEEAASEGEESEDDSSDAEDLDKPLSVISSPPFSWYRQSFQGMQMNPFSGPTLEFGDIPGINGVDENFMKTVAETAVGEVVVIPNFDRSTYYVVHVKARNPSGPEDPGADAVRQQFITENAPMSRIYGQMANTASSAMHQRWLTEFMRKYGIDPATLEQS